MKRKQTNKTAYQNTRRASAPSDWGRFLSLMEKMCTSLNANIREVGQSGLGSNADRTQTFEENFGSYCEGYAEYPGAEPVQIPTSDVYY